MSIVTLTVMIALVKAIPVTVAKQSRGWETSPGPS